MINHYEVLGVSEDADLPTIKAAVKQMRRRYHPDINKSALAHDLIVGANVAWEVLQKPERRAEHDRKLRDQRNAKKRDDQAEARAAWEATERAKAAQKAEAEKRKRAEQATASRPDPAAQSAKSQRPPPSGRPPPRSTGRPSSPSRSRPSQPAAPASGWRLKVAATAIGVGIVGIAMIDTRSMLQPSNPIASPTTAIITEPAPKKKRKLTRKTNRRRKTVRQTEGEATAAANRASLREIQKQQKSLNGGGQNSLSSPSSEAFLDRVTGRRPSQQTSPNDDHNPH